MYIKQLAVCVASLLSFVSYAEYVQSDEIDYKVFKEVSGAGIECDIETRHYTDGKEFRKFTNSETFDTCDEFEAIVDKTDTSVTFMGKKTSSYELLYEPGIPFVTENLADIMDNSEYARVESVYTIVNEGGGTSTGSIYSLLISVTNEDVTTAAGKFKDCRKTTWEYSSNSWETVDDNLYNFWWCEGVGLVKYESYKKGIEPNIWELNSISYKDQWATEQHAGFEKVHIYKPETESPIGNGRSLLVMLDGCLQNPDEYTKTANFEEVAENSGMVIAIPEPQYPSVAPKEGCWVAWEDDKGRDSVDYGNILQLARNLLDDQGLNIDPNQVYLAGFSGGAGFAMPMACLAPDVFAGVGIASGKTMDTYYGANPAAEEVKNSCLELSGDYSDWFNSQITSVAYGPNDDLIDPAYATLNAEVMSLVYGVDKQLGTKQINGGTGAIESLWANNRVSLLEINNFGHAWSGGFGASGYYISDKSINYLQYLADYFIENNKRVNRKPIITGTPATSVNENSEYVFTFVVTDDSEELPNITIDNKPSWATFDPITGTLSGTPDYGSAGIYKEISISAFDGEYITVLGPFDIEVVDVNRAPVIEGEPAVKVSENEEYAFEPVISDPDGDDIEISIDNKPSWAEFDAETGKLSGTPSYGDSGEYKDIVISVTDGKETVSLEAFTITVNNVNLAPEITGNPATSVNENSEYVFTFVVTDDSEELPTITIDNKPSWATFDPIAGTLTGTPDFESSGVYKNISISAFDGEYVIYLDSFDIEVININRAPVIEGQPTLIISENEEYIFEPVVIDLDSDDLTISIEKKPLWADFDAETGKLSGTPSYSDSGEYKDIVISVSDGKESVSLEAFSIEVINKNRPTSIYGNAKTTVKVGEEYSFIPEIEDADEDDLFAFKVLNLPTWATFNFETGEVTGNPTEEDVGVYEGISISVTDGHDYISLPQFNITVVSSKEPIIERDDDEKGGGGGLGLSILLLGLLLGIKRKKFKQMYC